MLEEDIDAQSTYKNPGLKDLQIVMSRETNINPLAAALYPQSLKDWTEFSKNPETAINA